MTEANIGRPRSFCLPGLWSPDSAARPVGFKARANEMRRARGGDLLTEDDLVPERRSLPGAILRRALPGVCLAVLLLAGSGHSQETEEEKDPFLGVEVMNIYADPTSALLARQGTSIIGFSNSDLEAYGVADISDIAAFVPNLEISSPNATNASFFVRGVGLQDFGANASSAVPIFQDGIVRNPSATQLVGLFDIGGLSVLRGPQGSGNYRNASAGAIVVDTAKPEPEFSLFALFSVANIVSSDATNAGRYKAEAAVTAPIFEDIVSIRLSSRFNHENPFIENGCANRVPLAGRAPAAFLNDASAQICNSLTETNRLGNVLGVGGELLLRNQTSQVRPYLKKHLGEVDDYGFRAQLRVQPPDLPLDLLFRAEISNLNRDSAVGQHIGTGRLLLGDQDTRGYRDPDVELRVRELEGQGLSRNEVRAVVDREIGDRPLDAGPFRGDFDSPGRTLVETTAVSITANADLDLFDIEFNAGFLDYRKSDYSDTDLSPNRVFPSNGNDQAWEVYVDLELSGESIAERPINWSVGAYTLLENVEATRAQSLPVGIVRVNKFDQEIYSFGLFGEAEYEFLEAFTIAAGARYNWEQKGFEVSDTSFSQLFTNTIGSQNQRTWDAMTGFVEIRYRFTEEIMTYLKYSRGFKAGHFNPSKPSAAKVPGEGYADPEQIDSFEWGLDFATWAGRITGSAALFYYNYKNYQVFRLTSTTVGVFRQIQNAKSARNYGAELEVTILPLDGIAPAAIDQLRLNFRGGWLETEFLEFTIVESRVLGGPATSVTIDNTGNPLISAPNLQASLTVVWPLQLDRFGTVTPQYDLAWTDDVPFDPNEGRGQVTGRGTSTFKPFQIGNRAYTLHNVRLSYDPPGESGTRISGWCRNVTDERYTTYSVDLTNFAGLQLHYLGDPRTCGVDVRFNW